MSGRGRGGHRGQSTSRGQANASRGGGRSQTDNPTARGGASQPSGPRGRGASRGTGHQGPSSTIPEQPALAPQNATPIRKPVAGIAARAMMSRCQRQMARKIQRQRRSNKELHILTQDGPKQRNTGFGSELVNDQSKEDTMEVDNEVAPQASEKGPFVSPFDLPLQVAIRPKKPVENDTEDKSAEPSKEPVALPVEPTAIQAQVVLFLVDLMMNAVTDFALSQKSTAFATFDKAFDLLKKYVQDVAFLAQPPGLRSMAPASLQGLKNPMDAGDLQRYTVVTSTIISLKPSISVTADEASLKSLAVQWKATEDEFVANATGLFVNLIPTDLSPLADSKAKQFLMKIGDTFVSSGAQWDAYQAIDQWINALTPKLHAIMEQTLQSCQNSFKNTRWIVENVPVQECIEMEMTDVQTFLNAKIEEMRDKYGRATWEFRDLCKALYAIQPMQQGQMMGKSTFVQHWYTVQHKLCEVLTLDIHDSRAHFLTEADVGDPSNPFS